MIKAKRTALVTFADPDDANLYRVGFHWQWPDDKVPFRSNARVVAVDLDKGTITIASLGDVPDDE